MGEGEVCAEKPWGACPITSLPEIRQRTAAGIQKMMPEWENNDLPSSFFVM